MILMLHCSIQFISYAQVTLDTIYVDEHFKPSTKETYTYYRILQQYQGKTDLYLQTDYYKTGEVKQMGTYLLKSKKALSSNNYFKLKNQDQLIPCKRWTMYYEPGMLGTVYEYEEGELILSYWMDYNLNEKIYTKIEQMPIFPGGPNLLKAHIQDKIKYPENAAAMKDSGRAVVSFWINKTGKVENIQLVRSAGSDLLDQEALRVASTIPNFFPGIVDGLPVIVYYTIPIGFRLQ